jgi:type IV pilus assembly protein PilA
MRFLKQKGFTLVELMIVIVIVGILAAVAIPKFMKASDKARASEFPTVLTGIYTQEEAYKAEIGTYGPGFGAAGAPTDIDMPSPSSSWFSYTITDANFTSTFQGEATVKATFGSAASGTTATINQVGTKSAGGYLATYVTTWK